MTLSTVTALAKLFGQYLLQPIPFTLTFLLPLLFRLIARKYIWLTLPLTALAEVLLNWDSFCYYEARGLALLFTLTQLAAMAVFVWILTGRRQKLPVNAPFLTEDRASRSTAAGSPHRAAAAPPPLPPAGEIPVAPIRRRTAAAASAGRTAPAPAGWTG